MYDIVTIFILVYTSIVCSVCIFLVYLIEADEISSNEVSGKLGIPMNKEEHVRHISLTVNIHFVLFLCTALALFYGK